MSAITNFVIEANLTLLLFALVYVLLLRKETDLLAKRFFILMSILISVIVPWISLPSYFDFNNTLPSTIGAVLLPEYSVFPLAAEAISQSSNDWITLWLTIYFTITAVLVSRLLLQIIKIAILYSKRKTSLLGDYTIINTDGKYPTFSFFKLLFFDNSISLSKTEQSKIIAHELVHIRQWHSADKLVVEILTALFWFNPAMWWIRNVVNELHEYLADDKAVHIEQRDEYEALLAKMTLSKINFAMGSHFSKSITIKRIKMMKTQKNKLRWWKGSLATALMILLFVGFSCNDTVTDELKELLNQSSMAEMPEQFKAELVKLQAKYPEADFQYMETSMKDKVQVAELSKLPPDQIGYANIDQEREVMGMLVNKKGALNTIQFASMQESGDDIFTVVEEQPTPVEGYNIYYQKIGENIQYPKEAKEAGIEGKVFVQFVVDIDGTLKDLMPVKGIDPVCDKIAVAAVANAGAWNPGKQNGKPVKVRMILPVSFKLGNEPDVPKAVYIETKIITPKGDN